MVFGDRKTQEKRGVTTRSLAGSREVHVLAKRPTAAVATGCSLWQAAHWALLLLVTACVCFVQRCSKTPPQFS